MWWEYFRLSELSAEDLLEERAGLSGLTFVEQVGGTARRRPSLPLSRRRKPSSAAARSSISVGGAKFGTVEAHRRLTSARSTSRSARTPPAPSGSRVRAQCHRHRKVLAERSCGSATMSPTTASREQAAYQAARDLLLRVATADGQRDRCSVPGETALARPLRIAPSFEGGVLPIQGPPGAGKTYTGARMICALVEAGAKSRHHGDSHKVIRQSAGRGHRGGRESRTSTFACIQKAG